MPRASETPDTGIVTPSATGFPPQPVMQVTTTDPAYKDIAVDNKRNPLATLMMHVQGSSWTVDYYSQMIDTDSPLMPQSPTVSAAYQGYTLVRGLELKVKTPLHQQQDDPTKMMEAEGDAYVYVGSNALIPNEGDAMLVDIGVGPRMVFRISATEKLSYFKEAVYLITYALASNSDEYLLDLVSKTVKDYTFKKDFLTTGQNPIIETNEIATIEDIESSIQRLTKQWFTEFFNREYMTVTVGSQTTAVYDHFLVDFMGKFMRPEDSPFLQKMRVLNVTDDIVMQQDNLWTALLERDPTYLKMGFTRTGIVYASEFRPSGWNQSVRYTGIDCVVYPLDPRVGIQGLQSWQIKTLITSTDPAPSYGGFGSPWWGTSETDLDIPNPPPPVPAGPPLVDTVHATNVMYPVPNTDAVTTETQDGTPQEVYAVLYDDNYVLSLNFYNETTSQSVLEAAVWAYLKHEALDAGQLNRTATLVYDWGVLERFYYIPLLIVLLRGYLRDYQG